MKIALINENSQAAKNEMICNTLKSVVEPTGHTVFNYGMYSAEDEHPLHLCPERYSCRCIIEFRCSRFRHHRIAVPARVLCLPAIPSRRYSADM